MTTRPHEILKINLTVNLESNSIGLRVTFSLKIGLGQFSEVPSARTPNQPTLVPPGKSFLTFPDFL